MIQQDARRMFLEVINRNNHITAKKKIRKWISFTVYVDPNTSNFAV